LEVVVGQEDRRRTTKSEAGGGAKLDYPQLGVTVVAFQGGGAMMPMLTPDRFQVLAKTATFWNKREVRPPSVPTICSLKVP
jgi:hypothetical protein